MVSQEQMLEQGKRPEDATCAGLFTPVPFGSLSTAAMSGNSIDFGYVVPSVVGSFCFPFLCFPCSNYNH